MNLPKQETRLHADDTRLIPLTQGQFAIVDAIDYEWLKHFKWQALWNKKTRSFYAARTTAQLNHKGAHTVMMHRQILGLEIGDKRQGDHIHSGETLDNRRSNLRIATGFQNQHNRRKRRDNSCGFKGVTPSGNGNKHPWKAEIVAHGEYHYLGCHDTPEEAHAAYCEAAKRLHGEFANLG